MKKKKKIFNETFFAILEMSILAVGIGCAYLLGHYDSLRYQEMINEKLSNCFEVCNFYGQSQPVYNFPIKINVTNNPENNSIQQQTYNKK